MKSFLLLNTGDYFLLNTGDRLVLNGSEPTVSVTLPVIQRVERRAVTAQRSELATPVTQRIERRSVIG